MEASDGKLVINILIKNRQRNRVGKDLICLQLREKRISK